MIFAAFQDFLQKKSSKPKILCIIGTTASGKTDLAVQIAKKYNGEIVNADSRQMYRYMPIGTAAPTEEEKQGVPHHLFEFVDPSQEWNVAEWKPKAVEKIREILKRGNLPIFCGGTGLFINALTKNFTIPSIPPHPEFREEKEKKSVEELWKELMIKDPKSAEKILPSNKRYVIRALEILEFSGEKKSFVAGQNDSPYDAFLVGVTYPRKELYDRINARVEIMKKNGFLREVEALLQKGYSEKNTALNAHGYPEAIRFLRNEISEKELWETMKKNTRNYAKRQLTWWRRDPRVYWFHSKTKIPLDIHSPEY
ncbi:tRNA (adenosine(37)-N6)-dimethylallyltransferase MiaA [Candidatus Peregrinibacteria bacterium]|nr:tRNA (adenosine(37)-N6)-dimethylallyltransferase MiaA [Candidatus Peregrinibacteria bacterium]